MTYFASANQIFKSYRSCQKYDLIPLLIDYVDASLCEFQG